METGFYYLQSRYYDPTTGRFLNADGCIDNRGINTQNLFQYCGNNPITRADYGGDLWDVVFDIASLVVSVVDVIVNPDDSMAWAGLAGDTVDLIPFVTGVGEVTRAARTTTKVVDKANDLSDASTTIYRSISQAEADDIIATGKFNLSPTGMEAKQFGLNYDETVKFGSMIKPSQNIVVSAQLPTNMLPQFYNGGIGRIDTMIFKSGTLTVYGEQLDAFNEAVRETIKFMP